MVEISSKIHMHDMITIDTIVFEIVLEGGGGLNPNIPPPKLLETGALCVSNILDRIRLKV